MVLEDLKPRDILTAGAFRNAAAAVLSVSGSINCIKHLQATAVEAGADVDVFALFDELSDMVPVLSAVAPNGTVKEARVVGGHPVLAQSALDAAKRWRFEPAASESTGVIDFKFESR